MECECFDDDGEYVGMCPLCLTALIAMECECLEVGDNYIELCDVCKEALGENNNE